MNEVDRIIACSEIRFAVNKHIDALERHMKELERPNGYMTEYQRTHAIETLKKDIHNIYLIMVELKNHMPEL